MIINIRPPIYLEYVPTFWLIILPKYNPRYVKEEENIDEAIAIVEDNSENDKVMSSNAAKYVEAYQAFCDEDYEGAKEKYSEIKGYLDASDLEDMCRSIMSFDKTYRLYILLNQCLLKII